MIIIPATTTAFNIHLASNTDMFFVSIKRNRIYATNITGKENINPNGIAKTATAVPEIWERHL